MKYVKYCKSKNNIFNSNTIQVGTLEYFQNTENEKLRDRNDGVLLSEVMDELITTNGPINLGGISIGGSGETPTGFKIETKLPKGLMVENRFNCYIFCLSMCEKPNIQTGKTILGSFIDSFYYFDQYYLERFITYLGNLLHSRIKQSDIHPAYKNKLNTNNSNLKLHVCDAKILYEDKIYPITGNITANLQQLAFYKSPRFKIQQEYRIAYVPEINGKMVEVVKTPKIIRLFSKFINNIT